MQVDVQIAPDGTLYIVDWHNALIGHLQHNLREPNRDRSHGRIWRLKHKTRPVLQPAEIEGQPVEIARGQAAASMAGRASGCAVDRRCRRDKFHPHPASPPTDTLDRRSRFGSSRSGNRAFGPDSDVPGKTAASPALPAQSRAPGTARRSTAPAGPIHEARRNHGSGHSPGRS